jgi:hypothetical protein
MKKKKKKKKKKKEVKVRIIWSINNYSMVMQKEI